MQVERYFHGSPFATSLVAKGVDMEAPRTSDPGDFGWGFYVDKNKLRCRQYGKVLIVWVDVALFAHLPDPYFLKGLEETNPETELERLFFELAFAPDRRMLTVKGDLDERTKVGRQIRAVFLEKGYTGIWTDKGEAVVFDDRTIKRVELYRLA